MAAGSPTCGTAQRSSTIGTSSRAVSRVTALKHGTESKVQQSSGAFRREVTEMEILIAVAIGIIVLILCLRGNEKVHGRWEQIRNSLTKLSQRRAGKSEKKVAPTRTFHGSTSGHEGSGSCTYTITGNAVHITSALGYTHYFPFDEITSISLLKKPHSHYRVAISTKNKAVPYHEISFDDKHDAKIFVAIMRKAGEIS
jgi:hypothetical protein